MTNDKPEVLPQFVTITLPETLLIGDHIILAYKNQRFEFVVIEDRSCSIARPCLKPIVGLF